MSRHSWVRGHSYNVCKKCGCRYQRGNLYRLYEHRNGTKTDKAGECPAHSEGEKQ